MPGGPRSQKQLEPIPTPSDPQEEAALDRAAEGLRRFMEGGGYNVRSLAAVAISSWIMARTSLATSDRIGPSLLLFNLKDARLRGMAESTLPSVAAALAHIPDDLPLFHLDKDQIIDVIVASVQAINEVAVALKESPFTADFNDPVPFGDP